MNDVQLTARAVPFAREWLTRLPARSGTDYEITRVIQQSFELHRRWGKQRPWWTKFDVHQFAAMQAKRGDTSETLHMAAIRLPGGSWLIGSTEEFRVNEDFIVESLMDEFAEAVARRERERATVELIERPASAHASSSSSELPAAPAPGPKVVPSDAKAVAVLDTRREPSPANVRGAERNQKPFTLGRCAASGVWAIVVTAIGFQIMPSGLAMMLIGVPVLGLPWLVFHLHDQSATGATTDALEAVGTLIGGAFLSGLCSLPLLLTWALLRALI